MVARVYLETTVISYLVGWLNQRDLYVAAQQEFTREWWTNQRHQYELFASAVVVKEARDGRPELAAARLAFLEEATLLEVTDAADQLKSEFLTRAASRARRSSMRFTSLWRPSMAWTIF